MKFNISYTSLTLMLGFMTFASAPAMSADPYQMKYTDNDWISVTGDVKSTVGDSFTLDFDGGLVTVEMDDWDWFNEASLLKAGEKVTVYGRIDKGWYEAKKIEAGSVYAHDRNTYFYANDADEEGDYWNYSYYSYPVTVPDGTWMTASGEVKDINGSELTLDIGVYDIKVDTVNMSYDPLDNIGYQQINKGDRIYVSGRLDIGFFERNEIQANSITTLKKDPKKKVNKGS